MPFKRVNTSNLMTFEQCFLISQYHENCNVMSSFVVLCNVPWNTFTCNECSSVFSLFCYLFLVMQHIASEHSQLASQVVEIPVEHSIFECNIQKSIPRLLELKKYYIIFKNRNVQLRFEIAIIDIKDQLMTNDKLLELS